MLPERHASYMPDYAANALENELKLNSFSKANVKISEIGQRNSPEINFKYSRFREDM